MGPIVYCFAKDIPPFYVNYIGYLLFLLSILLIDSLSYTWRQYVIGIYLNQNTKSPFFSKEERRFCYFADVSCFLLKKITAAIVAVRKRAADDTNNSSTPFFTAMPINAHMKTLLIAISA